MRTNRFFLMLKQVSGITDESICRVMDPLSDEHIHWITQLPYDQQFAEIWRLFIDEVWHSGFTLWEWKMCYKKAAALSQEGRRKGIVYTHMRSEYYPPFLKELKVRPPVLFMTGNPEAFFSNKTAAVTGTRVPTEFGEQRARRKGTLLAEKGFTVLSGLRPGCDAAAHEGALEAGGKTAAILPHGLDLPVQPPEMEELKQKIIRNDGVLVSACQPGVQADNNTLEQRDAILIGMSQGMLMTESTGADETRNLITKILPLHRPLGVLDHRQAFGNKAMSMRLFQGNLEAILRFQGLPVYTRRQMQVFLDLLEQKQQDTE